MYQKVKESKEGYIHKYNNLILSETKVAAGRQPVLIAGFGTGPNWIGVAKRKIATSLVKLLAIYCGCNLICATRDSWIANVSTTRLESHSPNLILIAAGVLEYINYY